MSGTLQLRLSKRDNNGRKHKRHIGDPMARTTRRNNEPVMLCESLFVRQRKEIRHKRTRTTGSSLGLENLRVIKYGKPFDLSRDHQALEPPIKENQSKKNLLRTPNTMVSPISALHE